MASEDTEEAPLETPSSSPTLPQQQQQQQQRQQQQRRRQYWRWGKQWPFCLVHAAPKINKPPVRTLGGASALASDADDAAEGAKELRDMVMRDILKVGFSGKVFVDESKVYIIAGVASNLLLHGDGSEVYVEDNVILAMCLGAVKTMRDKLAKESSTA